MKKSESKTWETGLGEVLSRAQMKNVLGGVSAKCPFSVCTAPCGNGAGETCAAFGQASVDEEIGLCSIWCNGTLQCAAGCDD
jgi:hypothetical protein